MMMLSPLLSIAKLVPIWAWGVAALLAWGGWQKHSATRATKAAAVAEQRAAVETATAEAERQARAAEQQFAVNARSAADVYASNTARVRASAAGARDELERLRNAVGAAPACAASPSATASGGVDATTSLRVVVGECAAALSQVAEAADRTEARLIGLQDYIRAIGAAPPSSSTPDKGTPQPQRGTP